MIKFYFLIFSLIFPVTLAAQNITGKIANNDSLPIEFANVILLQAKDSSFIKGTVTDKNGNFSLPNDNGNYLLKVSFLGFQTQIFEVKTQNIGTIYLQSEDEDLPEIIVTATRPFVKMENGGISIDIKHSRLKEIGTAGDVLAQLPLVTNDDDKIIVFGKGVPLIYLNNRLIRDLSELENINSNTINKISIITNPDAQYTANVKSVIKIETEKIQGEGLSGNLSSGITINRKFSNVSAVNLNYRINKLDLFGMAYISNRKDLHYINWEQNITNNHIFQNDSNHIDRRIFRSNLGLNYTFDDNNSMGMRYEYALTPKYNSIIYSSLANFNSNNLKEQIYSIQNRDENRAKHSLNAYFSGQFATWLLAKLDFDFIKGNTDNEQKIKNEGSKLIENIVTNGNQNNQLIASKLVFTTPFENDKLVYGSEFANTNNRQSFFITEQDREKNLQSNRNEAKQNLLAFFVTYNKSINTFDFDLGLRYEYVAFDYFVNQEKQAEQSRIYQNWFPSINLTYSNNDFQAMLGFDRSIYRPSYYQLRNNIQYNSPYSYESGNPFLKSSIDNCFSSSIQWKDFLFLTNFDIYEDIILLISEAYTEDIKLSKTENFRNFRNFSMAAFYSKAIKKWQSSLEISFLKDFFKYDERSYGQPIFRTKIKNSILLSKSFQIGADISYSTSGNSEIDYMYDVFRMNVYVSKTFFKDKLRINIQGNDILGTDKYKTRQEINNVSFVVCNDWNKRSISLSVSYNFNAAKSKYKGENAVKGEMNRL
ncbi:MAG: outer membrane beta-barrel protein [Prevotellaceae bacterium]|jgi:hypothetical protein|nr:outer membrane beta-barrel protein [Prevotellaceae bacterium]